MRKIGLTLAAVAALATSAVVNSPAEARGGRNAAIGFGVAAGVLGAAAAANAYNNGYHYDRDTATMMVDRMPTTTARDTIDAVPLATTRIGKEEARSNPGLFSYAGSNEQVDDRQHNQGCDAEVHHCEDATILSGVTFGEFTGHKICKWIRHGHPHVKERKGCDLRIPVKSLICKNL